MNTFASGSAADDNRAGKFRRLGKIMGGIAGAALGAAGMIAFAGSVVAAFPLALTLAPVASALLLGTAFAGMAYVQDRSVPIALANGAAGLVFGFFISHFVVGAACAALGAVAGAKAGGLGGSLIDRSRGVQAPAAMPAPLQPADPAQAPARMPAGLTQAFTPAPATSQDNTPPAAKPPARKPAR